ncbi:LOW QUALITY PROTEIN: pyroglutamyl-peptidase 1-like protein [Choloepus didactylus]|uniref:LOW QUALITY PROTEIN: pyroglutamyl-peptidase 1-like protein n=1 Tax=Choloepus didactylus TaxID=27675 RepID=UPI00189D6CAD|nr:LOW QUALITY PROTEIN: pyroglutamyl-peptidase 1-like protein [Choloepus didactylus]
MLLFYQELSKLGLGIDAQVELQTFQLPVDYREVKQKITRIWEDLQPQLVVHVGVDSSVKAIFLEQCGKNRGYQGADIRGFRPEGGVCVPGGPEVITSGVSLRAVCRRVAVNAVEVAYSRDAGRYVCDYTYYLSLLHGNGCAVLIHVPPLSPWLPASLLGKALQVLIQELLEEVGKPELPGWLAENSSPVPQAKGKQPRRRSFRGIKCFMPVNRASEGCNVATWKCGINLSRKAKAPGHAGARPARPGPRLADLEVGLLSPLRTPVLGQLGAQGPAPCQRKGSTLGFSDSKSLVPTEPMG